MILAPVPALPGSADTSDVEAALVALIAAASYPNLHTIPVKVFRGWPVPAQLDSDLNAGTVCVSVFPSEVEQKVTRHMPAWQELEAEPVTLALTVAGNTVTVSGTTGRYNCAVVIDAVPKIYPATQADTLETVASGLAALIAGATASGAALTVPGNRISTSVQGTGSAIRELRRQKKGYQVTVWCNTPQVRDLIAPLVDRALASVDYLPLPDGASARLLYQRTRISDRAERDGLYRRDLFYTAEFSTTEAITAPRVATVTTDVQQTL